MTGSGHRAAAAAPALAMGVLMLPYDTAMAICLAAGCFFGGVGPDILEIPVGTTRVIPHRTVTHTLAFWVAALLVIGASGYWQGWNPVLAGGFGFVVGGISHLSGDILTPSGIPLWHPGRRWSAQLSRAGGFGEMVWVAAWWGCSGLALFSVQRLGT